jgi:hypothetical protein
MWDPEFVISVGKYFCPPYWFFSWNFHGISNWVVLCMTFDKFIAVCFPLKAASWCTKRRAKVSAVLILLMWIGLNVPNIFVEPNEEAIRTRLGVGTCKFLKKYFEDRKLQEFVLIMVFTLWSLWIPMLGVFILNTIIVTAVRHNQCSFTGLFQTVAHLESY